EHGESIMTGKRKFWSKAANIPVRAGALAGALVAALGCAGAAHAQTTQVDDVARNAHPELAGLLDAFTITQAGAFDAIAEINSSPETMAARMELAMHLEMLANMTMREMMAMGGHSPDEMNMDMDNPFGEREAAARATLREQLRRQHDPETAAAAFRGSASLDRRTAAIIERGRRFERLLLDIYLDDAIGDKQAAVAEAIADYMADDIHSVASSPKNVGLLLTHDQAGAFQTGFPLLRGLLWSNQWLELAALEAVVLEHVDSNVGGGVDTALERFWNKMGSTGGMTMFPAPVELPMAPAIAPNLYSQSMEAAVIIDNLNVLETIVADIMAYPNLDNRAELIESFTAEFTNKTDNLNDSMSYLLFALRGGIYNQGGPAVGELMQSERNRSRSAMDMEHAMVMSQPM
ncbi:MAG: hypothetical protein OXE54_03490, partial [Gammaproteobacteria bacterium]|nr:hypothetical protein [Gammaproteobacteria bacterium]